MDNITGYQKRMKSLWRCKFIMDITDKKHYHSWTDIYLKKKKDKQYLLKINVLTMEIISFYHKEPINLNRLVKIIYVKLTNRFYISQIQIVTTNSEIMENIPWK